MKAKVYDTKTAAEKLNISSSLMRYYVRKGKVKSKRILTKGSAGRKFQYIITEEALLEFIKAFERKPRRTLSMIGPYGITRINGELITERIEKKK